MKKTQVICIGEALIDRIRNKSNQGFTDFLGGAPANVACALRKLRIDSIFIGRIGSDEFGKRFITQFNELKVNLDFLQLDNDYSTRIVNVDRAQVGDRFFSGFETSFHSCFADEALSKKLIEKELPNLEKLFLETKYFVSKKYFSKFGSSFSINSLLRASSAKHECEFDSNPEKKRSPN